MQKGHDETSQEFSAFSGSGEGAFSQDWLDVQEPAETAPPDLPTVVGKIPRIVCGEQKDAKPKRGARFALVKRPAKWLAVFLLGLGVGATLHSEHGAVDHELAQNEENAPGDSQDAAFFNGQSGFPVVDAASDDDIYSSLDRYDFGADSGYDDLASDGPVNPFADESLGLQGLDSPRDEIESILTRPSGAAQQNGVRATARVVEEERNFPTWADLEKPRTPAAQEQPFAQQPAQETLVAAAPQPQQGGFAQGMTAQTSPAPQQSYTGQGFQGFQDYAQASYVPQAVASAAPSPQFQSGAQQTGQPGVPTAPQTAPAASSSGYQFVTWQPDDFNGKVKYTAPEQNNTGEIAANSVAQERFSGSPRYNDNRIASDASATDERVAAGQRASGFAPWTGGAEQKTDAPEYVAQNYDAREPSGATVAPAASADAAPQTPSAAPSRSLRW